MNPRQNAQITLHRQDEQLWNNPHAGTPSTALMCPMSGIIQKLCSSKNGLEEKRRIKGWARRLKRKIENLILERRRRMSDQDRNGEQIQVNKQNEHEETIFKPVTFDSAIVSSVTSETQENKQIKVKLYIRRKGNTNATMQLSFEIVRISSSIQDLSQNCNDWVIESMELGKGLKKGHAQYKFPVFRYHNGGK